MKKDKNKKDKIVSNKKLPYILLIVIIVFLLFIFVVLPLIISLYEQHLEYPEIKEKIDDNVKKAVVFVGASYRSEPHVSGSSGVTVTSSVSTYPAGVGAIIFKKENNKYYALTANHAVNSDAIVAMYPIKYNENWLHKDYDTCPKITIEYSDDSKDLAIISFTSDEDWRVLNVSKEKLKSGDKVFTISSPDISDTDDYNNNRNLPSYGMVLSTGISSKTKSDTRYYELKNTFMSSLYTGYGSSGSGIINEKMEIVGIVHAGSRSLFGTHIACFGISNDVINEFLDDWKNKSK